ncbi:hypothetical protein SCMC78_73810 (plasmid) [Streptomyces sp. CMC78]|uniref:Uncharacterized protein n=1 Tax=Streptomyces sp. CMC78 TaxID=3231512 RepID=A0AB33KQ65_9ACTN|nr:hypothetical protein [Streptomyces sp. DE06-01C]MDX5526254.1 hypothetical protein [Streptomyces sp. DE06-01C]
MIRRRGRQAERAARRAAEHDAARVVTAADWAITLAVRSAGTGPVRVTPADVRRWAAEHFLLDVPEDLAADVLADRLRLRGYG